MNGFRNLKIKTKLTLLVTLFLVVFVAFASVAYTTLNSVKVQGPYYDEIIMGKNLVADVLPPPEYIIETYTYSILLSDPANRKYVPDYIKRIAQLRANYNTRHEYWLTALPQTTPADAEMRQAMVVDAYAPAVQFFDRVDAERFARAAEP